MSGTAAGLSAEIVTTGTEILLGEIVDTNAAWIAQQLREAGINLFYKTTVGDNEQRVRQVIELGLSRSDVIIVTGGLGPTKDDITRAAIAAATGRALVLHEGALETLKARFARFGGQMTENNVQQVFIPAESILIENPVGTAPGFIVESDTGTVIALPGVPREMKHLMQETVLPYLQQRKGDLGFIRRRVLRTVGIGESAVDHEIGDLMQRSNPTVGLAAHPGQVDVRLTAKADTEAEVETLLDELEATVRARIGRHIYSTEPNEPFVAVVARLLQEQRLTVALAETNTAGIVSQQLTAATGEYPAVAAAWTDASAPTQLAGVDGQWTVSEAVAVQIARGSRDQAHATFGLAVIGTRGDDEGVFGTQSGETWIALAGPTTDRAVRIPYGGREEGTMFRLSQHALTMLWRALLSAQTEPAHG